MIVIWAAWDGYRTDLGLWFLGLIPSNAALLMEFWSSGLSYSCHPSHMAVVQHSCPQKGLMQDHVGFFFG